MSVRTVRRRHRRVACLPRRGTATRPSLPQCPAVGGIEARYGPRSAPATRAPVQRCNSTVDTALRAAPSTRHGARATRVEVRGARSACPRDWRDDASTKRPGRGDTSPRRRKARYMLKVVRCTHGVTGTRLPTSCLILCFFTCFFSPLCCRLAGAKLDGGSTQPWLPLPFYTVHTSLRSLKRPHLPGR